MLPVSFVVAPPETERRSSLPDSCCSPAFMRFPIMKRITILFEESPDWQELHAPG